MLPSSDLGRQAYLELRDQRNRFRELMDRRLDKVQFAAFVLENLARDLELVELQEQVDFAREEGILSGELDTGLQNLSSWATECLRLIRGSDGN